jgi:UDP-N-acetyl-D-mannosaminuronate dehydrogenase
LRTLGATVDFHDPHVHKWTAGDVVMTCVPDLKSAIARSDVAVLLQAHREYDRQALGECGTRILDTRGVLSGPLVTRL